MYTFLCFATVEAPPLNLNAVNLSFNLSFRTCLRRESKGTCERSEESEILRGHETTQISHSFAGSFRLKPQECSK